MNHFRHGDVSFHQISQEEAEKLIATAKSKKEKQKKFVVALGEVTGHKHVMTLERPVLDIYGLTSEDMLLGDEVLFHVKEPGTMTHEEHTPITLDTGFYIRKIERDFDPFLNMSRRALD